MIPEGTYGPWDVAGYQLAVDFTEGVRLVCSRNGNCLRALPEAVRSSGDMAWIRVTLDAAAQHYRELRSLLEDAMVEQHPLSADDLALLALDPAGRVMLGGLVLETPAATGRPVLDEWLVDTQEGDLVSLSGPARVVHPAPLLARGELEAWQAWYGRRWFRQPFKQLRRETYVPDNVDRQSGHFSARFAGLAVFWDQARALLEGRGWYRVTKTGAERIFRRAGLTAHLEFRTPVGPSFSAGYVVLNRIYFLPSGEQVVNKALPGIAIDKVPPILFSEALRDAGLVAAVAARQGVF